MFIDDEGEDYMAADFVEDCEGWVVDLFERGVLCLGVGCYLGMMLFDFMPDLE